MQQRLQKESEAIITCEKTAGLKTLGGIAVRVSVMLALLICALLASGCSKNSSLQLKSKIEDTVKKADNIAVYELNHDANGAHENLKFSSEAGLPAFEGAVEALKQAGMRGTVTPGIPFDTVVYVTKNEEVLMKINYCMVDGRLKDSSSNDETALLIIPKEFRLAIRD